MSNKNPPNQRLEKQETGCFCARLRYSLLAIWIFCMARVSASDQLASSFINACSVHSDKTELNGTQRKYLRAFQFICVVLYTPLNRASRIESNRAIRYLPITTTAAAAAAYGILGVVFHRWRYLMRRRWVSFLPLSGACCNCVTSSLALRHQWRQPPGCQYTGRGDDKRFHLPLQHDSNSFLIVRLLLMSDDCRRKTTLALHNGMHAEPMGQTC